MELLVLVVIGLILCGLAITQWEKRHNPARDFPSTVNATDLAAGDVILHPDGSKWAVCGIQQKGSESFVELKPLSPTAKIQPTHIINTGGQE